jgi:hypothetical protein
MGDRDRRLEVDGADVALQMVDVDERNAARVAIDFAKERPTRSEPTSPGPRVTAMAERSESETFASSSAPFTMGPIRARCCLDASSGTTPP